MESNGSLMVLVNLYTSSWILMDFYKSLCALIDSNGCLWVLYSRFSCVLMNPCGSLCVLIDFNGSLLVFKVRLVSLWNLMCPNVSLYVVIRLYAF